jgi:peptide/nickel transport system permease protein
MNESTQEKAGVLVFEEAAVRRRAGLVRVIVDSFLRNRTALFGVLVIVAFTVAAIGAPFLTSAGWLPDPYFQDYDALRLSPSLKYPAGTDTLGRDNFTRIIYGGRVSLQVGILAVVVATSLGVTIGLAAGYFGRWTDSVLMRIVDAILAFPPLLLAIMMVAVLGPSLRNAMLAIAVGFIPSFARITRANTLSIREKEYVESARALGAGPWRIMFKTILPNTMSPIIVQASLGMSYAILIEASLSFLGLGIQPPTPSWGYMLSAGREFITLAWWLTTLPGFAIFLIVLAWNFVGDGIREALDPRQQRR